MKPRPDTAPARSLVPSSTSTSRRASLVAESRALRRIELAGLLAASFGIAAASLVAAAPSQALASLPLGPSELGVGVLATVLIFIFD